MRQNMELIKSDEMFCVESAAATVAKYNNRHFEMMFTGMLGFDFDYTKAIADKMAGNNLFCGYTDESVLDNLSKYHGIRCTENRCKCTFENEKAILQKLKESIPFGMWFDYKLCGSTEDKGKTYLLFCGYTNSAFVFFDVHEGDCRVRTLNEIEMVEYLTNTEEITYHTYQVEHDFVEIVYFDDFVNEIKNTSYYKDDSVLEKMYKFADYIETYMCLTDEAKGYSNCYFAPLFLNLTNILRARKLIASSLEYIHAVTGECRAEKLSKVFNQLFMKWKVHWLVFQKVHSAQWETESSSYKSYMKKTADGIRALARYETKVIRDICMGNIDEISELVTIDSSYFKRRGNGFTGAIKINLTDYFNNRAFAFSPNNEERADISGQGEFFVLEKETSQIGLVYCEKEIIMNLQRGEVDNVSCEGQIIAVSGVKCRGLFIIGCCEWEDGQDDMIVSLKDDSKYTLSIEMSDWYGYEENPHNIWIGNAIDYKQEITKRGLYGYFYNFNEEIELKDIVMPNDNHMHIFMMLAIS